MQGKIKRQLVSGSTVDGYRSFAAENLRGVQRVFLLLGAAGCGKSSIIARVAAGMAERGLAVEVWQVADEPGAPEGVVIPELSAAVVDAGFMEWVQPRLAGVVEEVCNLAACWDGAKLRENEHEINELAERVKRGMLEQAGLLAVLAENQPRMYAAAGLRLSEDELEKIATGLAEEIFARRNACVRRFFAAAATQNGWYSVAQENSSGCRRRILLGNGAAELLARVADEAAARGLSADLYFDILRPEKLQMVILPEISVAVADAELPGLMPLYTDELFGRYDVADVSDVGGADSAIADSAQADFLAASRKLEDDKRRLAAHYTAAMDFERVDGIGAEILAKLWQMAGERGL